MSGKADYSDIARRYATAFIELAEEGEKLAAAAKDMAFLAKLMETHTDFIRTVSNQNHSAAEQAGVMLAIAEQTKMDDLTRNFVGTVAENRRLALLPQIVEMIQAMLTEKSGEITAKVTSAAALTEAQTGKLEETLKKALGTKIQLELKEDPQILGGLIVKVGSTMVDNSVRTKLQRLKRAMKHSSASNKKTKLKEVA